MSTCVIHPRLKNGEKSPLFTRLKEFLGNHTDAEEVYYRTINPDFRKVFPQVRYDSNNEAYFDDLLRYCGLDTLQGKEAVTEALNREFGTEPVPVNVTSVGELQKRASAFNTTSSYRDQYNAVVTRESSGVAMRVEEATEDSAFLGRKQRYNAELNTRLVEILNSWGMQVEALTELEESLGIDGMMDVDSAENAATGLKTVIRIAKGIRGQEALPEEFGHFVVEGMKSTPIRDRVLKSLENEEALRRIMGDKYEDYLETYKGDMARMAKKALGKLVAEVLNYYDSSAPNTRLFERYKKQVLDFFASKDENALDAAMREARELAFEYVNNVFTGKYMPNVSTVGFHDRLYSLSKSISREEELLAEIIRQEQKRLNVYGTKANATVAQQEAGISAVFETAQRQFLGELMQKQEQADSLQGIYRYLENAVDTIQKLAVKLDTVHGLPTNRKKFSVLKNIHDYILSYGVVIDRIREETLSAKRENDSKLYDTLKDLLHQYTAIVEDLGSDWMIVSKNEFSEFCTIYEGETLAKTIKGEDRHYTIKELLDHIEGDITLIERWLDAMADSTDPILRIYDNVVTTTKGRARLKSINYEKEILAAARKLELAGITDTEWMYERDSDGRITTDFVTAWNWGNFYNDYNKAKDKILGREDISKEDKEVMLSAWRSEHMQDGHPDSRYLSTQYEEIMKDPNKKEYYDLIMSIKRAVEIRMPARYVKHRKAPQIRKDLIERVLKSGNTNGYLWESIKDGFVRREDDTDFYYARQDFEGNDILRLPIYYTKRITNPNDLSLDCTSAMIAYAAMCVEYTAMDDVVDALEVGRTILNQRDVYKLKNGKLVMEDINGVRQPSKIKGSMSKSMERLNDFMLMQVYGRWVQDNGELFGMDVNKLVSKLGLLTSLTTTAASLLTGTANLIQNVTMANIEAIAGRYFSKESLARADWEYTKMLPEYLGELGNRIKISKMALFAEKFNVLQDYGRHVRSTDWDKKTWFTRYFKLDTLWFTTSCGDHYTQMRTALARAIEVQVINPKGESESMLDALEVKYIDDSNPQLGATLVYKEGYKDAEGNPLTGEFDVDYTVNFSNAVRGTNDKLYGIYNTEGKNAMQSRAFGRMVMMYRNWMRPMYLKRYGVRKYNYDTKTFQEGYYRTLYQFTKGLAKDLKEGSVDIALSWDKLDNEQKANIKNATAELATFLFVCLAVMAVKCIPDDDDDDKDKTTDEKIKSWFASYGMYGLYRVKADLGALIPGPTMIKEGIRLFKSPFAQVITMQRLARLTELILPDTWADEVESGVYKGHTKAFKIITEPLPMVKQFLNVLDPSVAARWYK